MSYTVGKVFKSLTQESCKETKRRITNQINAGNVMDTYVGMMMEVSLEQE